MSVRYRPVTWNSNKIIYDMILLIMVVGYILIFIEITPNFQSVTRRVSGAIFKAQAFGSAGFLMLTLILCIGPLARLDTRFLPLLYNRRHFGVMTCAVAFVHVAYIISIYFSFSSLDKYAAVLAANTSYGQLLGFPFEAFGLVALLILLILAVTSHDFWLHFLTPPVWKAIHMSVYLAYTMIVLHVSFGYLQASANPLFAIVVTASVFAVASLHFVAGRAERRKDRAAPRAANSAPWMVAGKVGEIPEDRAIIVSLEGDERVAIFRHGDSLSALSNVCAHQNGPLGEGRVIDGCVTCPWHGFQYRVEDGRAPAPFTERIATYRLKLDGDTVLLDPRACEPGTRVEPIKLVGAKR